MDGDKEFGIQSFTVKLGQKKVSKFPCYFLSLYGCLVAWKFIIRKREENMLPANGLTSSEFSVQGILAMCQHAASGICSCYHFWSFIFLHVQQDYHGKQFSADNLVCREPTTCVSVY